MAKNDLQCSQSDYLSPIGRMCLLASPSALLGVWFDGQAHQPDLSAYPRAPSQAVLREATEQLQEYFAGVRQSFNLALDLRAGTAFQQSVWQALLTLPFGQTCSYAALAEQIGRPRALRAVAGALARNPCCVVLPCHRVLGRDASLTGYAGGLARKRKLLQLEGVF